MDEVMNNENNEIETINDEPIIAEANSLSNGAVMLIGMGLAFAITAGVKLGKKAFKAFKARDAKKHEEEIIEEEFEEIKEEHDEVI